MWRTKSFFKIDLIYHKFSHPPAETTSLNNNNNNNSLNANHTITYANKSTQTGDETSPTSESRIAETQTETFTTHSDSICCLNSIPYVDQSMTPPVVHKAIENCTIESKNPFTIDSSICPATQTAMAIATTANGTSNATTQLDNGDLVHQISENNCNEFL